MQSQSTREEFVRVQKKGLITIPKSMRDEHGFKVNEFAKIKSIKGRLVLEPVRTLPYKVRSYANDEVGEFLGLDDKETEELQKEGLL